MMRLSRNLKIFAGVYLLYSVAFNYLLSRSLTAGHYEQIWMFASGYGLLTFFTALALGAFDPVRTSRGDLGFQYHLVTFVLAIVVWVVWLLAGRAAEEQASLTYVVGLGAWGLGLLAHYVASRAKIKGISKREMFD